MLLYELMYCRVSDMEIQEFASAIRWLCDGLEPELPAGVLRSRLALLERLEGIVVSTKAEIHSRLTPPSPSPRPKPAPLPPAGGDGGGDPQPANRPPQRDPRDAKRAWILKLAPWFDAALKAGLVTVEHVDALALAVERLKPTHQPLLLALDTEILTAAKTQIPKVFAATLQALADRVLHRVPEDRIAEQRRDRSGRLYVNNAGMGCAYLQTDSDTHAEIETFIETEVQRRLREQPDPDITPEQVRADVIADLLRGQTASKTAGGAAGVLVITNPATLTNTPAPAPTTPAAATPATLNGKPITAGAAQRILCDRDLIAIIQGADPLELDAYRLQRLATDSQRAALAALYPTCPCCDTAFWRCEIHHADFWELGGTTNLDNLVPVCARLHHLLHDQHWRLELDPDRTIRLYRPDGTHHRTIPPPHANAA